MRLPSITNLRAFEAAARHLSFTRAAVELNLTQTAISHQIRNLEDLLGTKLFVRNGNGVALTEVAVGYLATVRPALIEISAATDRAADRNDENVLTLQCLGTFAVKRLLPSLNLFQSRYPAVSLRLRTVQSFESTMPHDFDLAIWHGAGDWPGVAVDKLAEEEIFPVCSPRLIAERGPLDAPVDLARHTVIRTVSLILRDEWPFWLETAGMRDIAFGAELTCDYLITSMQAAVDGLGVVLGRSGVVGPDLASGRLVEPFGVRARSSFGYYLVVPLRTAKLRKVQLFRRWLLDQMQEPVAPAAPTLFPALA